MDRVGTGIVAALLLMLLMCAPARAAVTVNTEVDGDDLCQQPPNGDCTLREALAHSTTGDTVIIPAGDYTLTLGPLNVAHNLTVRGAGASTTTVHGVPSGNRVLIINTGVTSNVSGLTITGGNAPSGGEGGGVYVAGTLTFNDSTVAGNHAWDGAGVYTDTTGTLTMQRVTVSGNQADNQGGGVALRGPSATIVNSTISGNTAVDGGGILASTHLQLTNVTVAENEAGTAGGLSVLVDTQDVDVTNTILVRNGSGACGGVTSAITSDFVLTDDASCDEGGIGNQLVADAKLGNLAGNGGPTLTHLPLAGSPAIDRGSAGLCPATDQRGVARPMGTACDIGAVEIGQAPGSLRVVTTVVNDSGGTSAPADVTVRVRRGSADVSGSPAPGTSAGKTYSVQAGSYTVAATAPAGYTVAIGGACAPSGAVTVASGTSKTCTVTANDPAPEVHETAIAAPADGTVKVKLPGSDEYVTLTDGVVIPLGTVVDTRRGRVTIIAAANGAGGTATAVFYAGIFKLGQTKGAKPITELTLVEKLACPKKSASAAAKKKRKRRLWGDGKGRFRTKGKHSAATVVGTRWLVEDRCTSTLTRVARGKVRVTDFVKHKTVLVKAPRKYVARARRG